MNIGSLSTLELYAKELKDREIMIRINPDLGAGEFYNIITGGPHSKFGIYAKDLEAVR